MRINLSAANGDVVESALLCAIFTDVVSRQQKREMMAQLGAMKQSLGCPPNACGGCARRTSCEERVLDILAM